MIWEHMAKWNRTLDSRSEGLGFDFHSWSYVEASGKHPIPYYLCPPNSDGYLVEQKLEKLWMALAAESATEFSPQEMRPYKREF